jgi:hypothetical protein
MGCTGLRLLSFRQLERMNQQASSPARSHSWLDLIALGFMSLSAPVISALIHSTCVFQSGIRFYNAELWGLSEHLCLLDIISWIGSFGLPALITFLVILPFRKSALNSWMVWIGFVALWTLILFKMEYAIN